ncbi:hypothetical protein [Sphaerimonospora mesophila]|uniref:hypothetical protein n=1 Tax=Sphaerimonospora mesophila TaxID=37483 RepID=UPI00139670ED
MTLEGSTHVDTAFTGTTSSFSRTATGKVAVVAVVRQQVFAEDPGPAAKAVTLSQQDPTDSQCREQDAFPIGVSQEEATVFVEGDCA